MKNLQNQFTPDNRSVSEKAEHAYMQYLKYWETYRGQPSVLMSDISADLHGQIILEEFSRNEKSVKVFFDQTHFRILYITDNVEDVLGYTAAEMLEHNTSLLFESFTPQHVTFPMIATRMIMSSLVSVPIEILTKNLRMTYCGVQMKHKDKSIRRLMIRYSPLELDENSITRTSIISINDVTHLMKSDFYWGRMVYGDEEHYKEHFISNVAIKQSHDIISNREKEVLRLIAKGLESKDIARELFISSGTVDNHRKNMIARTGARDTTALVQLCLSCDII
jgi:DNA-binding CsgD family transcriptional regulator